MDLTEPEVEGLRSYLEAGGFLVIDDWEGSSAPSWGARQRANTGRAADRTRNAPTELGDAWEWSENTMYPFRESSYAYELAINYIIYAMTH